MTTQQTNDGSSDEKKIHPDAEIESLISERNEYLNGWKRAIADLDNFKKENAKRSHELQRYQLVDMINNLLPLMDALHETIKHIPPEQQSQAWYQGLIHMTKLWDQFMRSKGIQKFDPLGTQFNPELHEAIQSTTEKNKKDQEITAVLTPGYMLDTTLIRPARVSVNTIK